MSNRARVVPPTPPAASQPCSVSRVCASTAPSRVSPPMRAASARLNPSASRKCTPDSDEAASGSTATSVLPMSPTPAVPVASIWPIARTTASVTAATEAGEPKRTPSIARTHDTKLSAGATAPARCDSSRCVCALTRPGQDRRRPGRSMTGRDRGRLAPARRAHDLTRAESTSIQPPRKTGAATGTTQPAWTRTITRDDLHREL